MLNFFDSFFLFFHSALILFNLLGWLWKPTRKLNLVLLLCTAASWFILGIWYGWGYCFLTDWHFKILMKLNVQNLPSSYIKYLADRITGLNFYSNFIDVITLVSFLSALSLSGYYNYKDYRKRGRVSREWYFRNLVYLQIIIFLNHFMILRHYGDAIGAPVDADHFRFWRLFGEVKHSIISLTAARSFADGRTRNIRHADRATTVTTYLTRFMEWLP